MIIRTAYYHGRGLLSSMLTCCRGTNIIVAKVKTRKIFGADRLEKFCSPPAGRKKKMDKKERIERFEKLRMGLFMHFGLYSMAGEGEWAFFNNPKVAEKYGELFENFNPEKLDFEDILSQAKAAGMKYAVLTTRHHDGFSLYDTRGLSEYDVMHTPFGKDIIKLFTDACRKCGMMPFFYHTMHDWQNPLLNEDFDAYLKYLRASVEVLCTNYGDVGGFWFDGCWSNSEADWQLDDLYSMIRKHQPDAMIINNTGLAYRGIISHPYIDAVTYEQGHIEKRKKIPGVQMPAAEACETLNNHWGFARLDINYRSPKSIIEALASSRGFEINYLMNIGPRGDGTISPYDRGILDLISIWMEQVRDIFYDAETTDIDAGSRNFVLEAKGKYYLFVFDNTNPESEHDTANPVSEKIILRGMPRRIKTVKWRDNGCELAFSNNENGEALIEATGFEYGRNLIVRVAEIECE